MSQRRAVMIYGMHRSGTSALSRVVSLRGAALPQNLMQANEGNVTGYWEPANIVVFNDEMLAHFGVDWFDPFAAFQLPPAADFPDEFYVRARDLIEAEYGDAEMFVLKDPRCTLLHAFWTEALARIGIEVCPVALLRPCAEVVQSLRKRDQSDPVASALLYVAYGLEAAIALHGRAAACLTYDQLLDDWRVATDRIAGEFGFRWRDDSAEAAAQIEQFLQPGAAEPEPLHLPEPLATWVDSVWGWFRAMARGEARDLAPLLAIRGQLAAAGMIYAPLLVERKQRLRASNALFEQAHQSFLRTVGERDALMSERDRLLSLYQATDAELTRTKASHVDLASRVDQLVERNLTLQQQYEQLQIESQARIEQLWRDSQARIEQLESDGQILQRQLDETYASRSWKITAPLRRVSSTGQSMLQTSRRWLRRPTPTIGAPLAPDARPAGHDGLRAFLSAEFGAKVAAETIARIDRFQLPVDTGQVRAAATIRCSDEQAARWAADIAARAAPRFAGDEGAPDVSIVLPVYNQVSFTLACIDALIAHQTRYRFEILVGDDASSDATALALATPIAGLRHIRHADNLGFVRNCNATAAQARGRHIVLLNNDTQVLPGWLDELIDVLDGDPGVGLAGSKLIYPDGRLQECGGIVWRDGSAWNLGRLDDPRRPEFCYLRDTDYVSGASIAVPAPLWRQLGGFDELFVPAYAEDVDLAFRVRAAGLRTVVQPLSQVLHFEGVSSGTDLAQGAKAHQVENLKKLHARWRETLAGHRDNADRPELEKERTVARRLLFVDHCTLTPNEDAGSLVAFEILQALRKFGFKATFIPEDNFADMGEDTRALQRLGVEAIYHPSYSRMADFLATRDDPFDLIVLHRFGVGDLHLKALKAKFPRAKVLFLVCDLHFLRQLREAELSQDPAALAAALDTKRRELAVARAADVTVVYSEVEHELLAVEAPQAPALVFPLVHEPVPQRRELARREGVCFIGGYRHAPNADGIIWFVEQVWPLVRARCPQHALYIAGSQMTAEVTALGEYEGVRIVGFVEDLDEFLAARRASVAPLRFGAGVKGKVAASLAHGVPAVCTPIAAEGMQLTAGVNVLVGATPAELAEQLVRVLTDDAHWHAVSDAGLAYAADVTSRASAERRIGAMLAQLGLS